MITMGTKHQWAEKLILLIESNGKNVIETFLNFGPFLKYVFQILKTEIRNKKDENIIKRTLIKYECFLKIKKF